MGTSANGGGYIENARWVHRASYVRWWGVHAARVGGASIGVRRSSGCERWFAARWAGTSARASTGSLSVERVWAAACLWPAARGGQGRSSSLRCGRSTLTFAVRRALGRGRPCGPAWCV